MEIVYDDMHVCKSCRKVVHVVIIATNALVLGMEEIECKNCGELK